MARRKSRARKVSARGYRASRGIDRKVTVTVWINRRAGPGFEACARTSGKGTRFRSGRFPEAKWSQCAISSAPRRAMAASLEKLAKSMRKRSSAFAGVR